MQDHRRPESRAHVRWERSQVAVFLIESIVEALADIVIDLICSLVKLLQGEPRPQRLDPHMVIPV